MFSKKLVCALIVLYVLKGYSQHQPVIVSQSEADGLSDNRVNCFLRDKRGFVWIGTANGLNRFDGLQYKIYQPVVTDAQNTLPNAFITSIKEDNKNNLWIGTHKGVSKINPQGKIENFLPSWKGAEGLPGDLVWDILPENDTSIWVAIDSRALVRFNPVTKKYYEFNFKAHLLEHNIRYTRNYHSIFRILSKNPQELWLATTEGIFSFDKRSGTFSLLHGMRLDNIRMFYTNSITQKLYCIDEAEKIYIVDADNKLEVIDTNIEAGIKTSPKPYTFPGALVCIPGNGKLIFLDEQNNTEVVLPLADELTTTYKDHEGIWWIGTGKGFKRIMPGPNKLLHILFSKNLESASQYPVKNFMYDATTKSWLLVSFRENKIWSINDQSGEVSEIVKPVLYKNDVCSALFSNNSDTVYFLGQGFVLEYAIRAKRWNKISFPAPLHEATITAMEKDAKGNYWIGTQSQGLFRYDARTKKVWFPSSTPVPAHLIAALQYDAQQHILWVGTYSSGFYRYAIDENIFLRVERNDGEPRFMHSSLINDITTATNGNIWVATWEGGLSLLNYAKDSLHVLAHIDMKKGLPENTVYGIAKANDNNLFLSTGKGIVAVDKQGNITQLYNAATGLPFSKFVQRLEWIPGNKVASISDNNFICFNAGKLISPSKNNVLITEVLLGDSVNIVNNKTKLSYQQNDLLFSFVLPEFATADAVEYFYMLKGNDKDWINNKLSRTARYSNLSPDKYEFMVKAKLADGSFSTPASWPFVIQPPFWLSWWFKTLCVLVAIGAIVAWQKNRERKLHAKAAERALVQQQMAALEVKALRSQMNPHFIFNSLNSINMLVAGGQNEKSLLYIQKFSRLLRMVLNESDNNTITLSEEINMLELYLQLEQLRFGESFTYRIENKATHADDILLPAFIVQPIVENAIWHGLLHKQGERKLYIRFTQLTDKIIECVVEDNGIGIKAANQVKKLQLSDSNTSRGIQMIKERLKLLYKEQGTVMYFETEDIGDQPEKGSGTRVTIKIPVIYET